MKSNGAFLKSVKRLDGESSGTYECSECGERYPPNPLKPEEMQLIFMQHKGKFHPELE